MKQIQKIMSFLCIFALFLSMAGCNTAQSSAANEDTALEQTEKENTLQTEPENKKLLVAYFSATGTTKALAEYAAAAMDADLYEIVPQQQYTSEDLNYGSDNSRTSIEMGDPSARPAISGSVENMEQYEIIFIGYPIWWGEAPRIISTFMESYDFSGKTIVPFCTSGSSDIGSSAANLHGLCAEDALWLDGARLSGSFTQEDMAAWIDSLGLDIQAQ